MGLGLFEKGQHVVKGLHYHIWFTIRFALIGWWMIPACFFMAWTFGFILNSGNIKETKGFTAFMVKDLFYGDKGWYDDSWREA